MLLDCLNNKKGLQICDIRCYVIYKFSVLEKRLHLIHIVKDKVKRV